MQSIGPAPGCGGSRRNGQSAEKMHGGLDKSQLDAEDLTALERGIPNLLRHVRNIKNVYHLPCVVALNRFPTDTEAELKLVEEKVRAA